jgi:carotenoid 1,2-hydratase
VGPSRLSWREGCLTIDIDEIAMPFLGRVRGRVVVEPDALFQDSFDLDAAGCHQWRPIAPSARARVTMQAPAAVWEGTAYVDSNTGSAPLESAFSTWDWSRGKLGAGATTPKGHEPTLVIYDVRRRDGSCVVLAKRFDVSAAGLGCVTDFVVPPSAPLPRTGWRVARATACDLGSSPAVIETLEDTPFYSRSIVSSTINGAALVSFHESLSLERFSTRWVQTLLPFKMPRRR